MNGKNTVHYVFMLLLTIIFNPSVFAEEDTPTDIDKMLYFDASIRDAEYCSMIFSAEHNQLIAVNKYNPKKLISNPAMTCPDMFSWKLFTEVIVDQFWSHWADETQNWPAKPYAMCTAGQDPSKDACCQFGSNDNSPEHCPIYPGKIIATKRTDPKLKSLNIKQLREKAPELIRSTRISFHGSRVNKDILTKVKKSLVSKVQSCTEITVDGKVQDVTAQIYANFIPSDPTPESIGRVIRQTNAELTVRNEAFHNYLFKNNLYNTSGLIKAFNASNENLKNNAPYHRNNRSAQVSSQGKLVPGELVKIDLPPDAIMIKSNWLHHKLAEKLGMSTKDSDYVHTIRMATDINLKDLGITKEKEKHCQLYGTHYLVAFHISSKDIPNWVWTTFEHMNLPGRCDITGCNDSYGYKSADPNRPKETADNYVVANQQNDKLNQSSDVFKQDAGYNKEEIRSEWNTLLAQLKIGVKEQTAQEPAPADQAWRNYRLKGSQVEFVDAKGMPTTLGNSVTEAGFMDGSSCISCHSRAAVATDPTLTVTGANLTVKEENSVAFPLSVFQRDLTDFGYARSVHGVPNPSWFYNDHNTKPEIEAMQTDFIWGFLFARDVVPPSP